MADEPVSTTVPETVTIETGAEPQAVESLNKQFEDFWKETDAEAAPSESKEPPPAAPGESGPAQETKKTTPVEARRAPPETKPVVPVETKPAAKELSDDDIDRIELPPQGKVAEHFKQVKDLWKTDRVRMRAEVDRAAKLEQELATARQNAWTPEQKADYEHAAQIRRQFDFASDPEFSARFREPIARQYNQILDDAVAALPDRQAAEQWARYMRENYNPDQLNREYWLRDVINKVPDELERSSLLSNVTQLLKLQKERDTEVIRRTADKSAFDNYITERTKNTAERVQQEIMTEIGEQEKRIVDYLPRNLEDAKTTEERQAIEAHNERFTKLNDYFKGVMQDLSQHGPRAWVRASVEATRSLILEQNYQALEKDFNSVKAERDRYKAELDKIVGARKKMSSTTGTPPASTLPKKDGQGLSLRDLDVRKSFESFDWGDSSK
jgi:hypothetical protein